MKNKKGEWLLVNGKNFMSIQPQYCCSICKDMISTYYPPDVCKHCGSINEYKGNSISVKIESDDDDDEFIVPYDKVTLETQNGLMDEINDLLKDFMQLKDSF